MGIQKLKIDLNEEESQLLNDLIVLQEKAAKYNPKEMNQRMLDEIEKAAIDSIAVALNISDVLENQTNMGYNTQQLRERSEKNANEFKDYKETAKNMATQAGKNKQGGREHYIDYMTGEELIGGDPEKGYYDYDHVISAKELKDDILMGVFLSEKEMKDFLNSEKNLFPTNKDINREFKNTKTWKELSDLFDKPCKKDPSKTNAEYYHIDTKIAHKNYLKVRTSYYKRIGTNAAKSIGGYALKMTAFKFVKIVVAEIIYECKLDSNESIVKKIKRAGYKIISRLSELWDTFKESAFANFISALIDIAISFFLDTTKKAFKIIRQTISHIFNAIKILLDDSKPMSERINVALKIIGAALVASLGVLLEEVINKAVVVHIPILAPIANYLSPVLAALITGVGSVLILQLYSKYQSNIEYKKVVMKISNSKNKLHDLNVLNTVINEEEATEMVSCSIFSFANACYIARACENEIKNSLLNIKAGSKERKIMIENIQKNQSDIDEILLLI